MTIEERFKKNKFVLQNEYSSTLYFDYKGPDLTKKS